MADERGTQKTAHGVRLPEISAPTWLVEVVRPRQAKPDWWRVVRSGIAVVTPIVLALLSGNIALGMIPAMGAMATTMADQSGPYRTRLLRALRIAPSAAAGFAIGDLVNGSGWIAVVVMVLLALLSALFSAFGNVGSVAGLQMLLFASLGSGMAMSGPRWLGPLLFLAGAAWAVLLTLTGWLFTPSAPERRAVAAAYRALADMQEAVGTDDYEMRRQDLTTALNAAYDTVLRARSTEAGPDSDRSRLVALLNQTNPATEATLTVASEGRRPRPEVVEAVRRTADAIMDRTDPPEMPPPIRTSPGSRAMAAALANIADVLSGRDVNAEERALSAANWRERLRMAADDLRGGWLFRQHAVRLMACMAVAGVLTEMLVLERSYWVQLTIAIVLKPDFGSVFGRALQRAGGTVIGVFVGGALVTVVPYGPWILVPLALFAALMPLGQQYNYGLFTAFNAPLVVLLVDLLTRGGWDLVWARMLDTLLGCGIVLIIGYAPWPSSWHARVGIRFADAVDTTRDYLEHALASGPDSERRRGTYRALSDLRTVFQRALSEPRRISERATYWWPAVVDLERLADQVTATAIGIRHGQKPPDPEDTALLAAALSEVADAVRAGDDPRPLPLPDNEELDRLSAAVRGVRSIFLGPEQPSAAC